MLPHCWMEESLVRLNRALKWILNGTHTSHLSHLYSYTRAGRSKEIDEKTSASIRKFHFCCVLCCAIASSCEAISLPTSDNVCLFPIQPSLVCNLSSTERASTCNWSRTLIIPHSIHSNQKNNLIMNVVHVWANCCCVRWIEMGRINGVEEWERKVYKNR